MKTHIWFRAESKPLEKRAALTPKAAKKLIEAGFRITVEESSERAFAIDEYKSIGCEIAIAHSWQTADSQAIILGLKELEPSDQPLCHRHIHFAHVYKHQQGWKEFLRRFVDGQGSLYDLEYLVDGDGRRIAAFGHWAGFAGMVLAAKAYCGLIAGTDTALDPITTSSNQDDLIAGIQQQLQKLSDSKNARPPSVLVIGAGGRSGRGAVQACELLGLAVEKWDLAETKKGGPFPEIISFDILINCVFVQQPIPPFVTTEILERDDRQLQVICDVSCDPYGDYNPLPIYDRCTTFDEPTLTIHPGGHHKGKSNRKNKGKSKGKKPLHLIAIDHLPSLLPVESSLDYCDQLLPALLQLHDLESPVWKRARSLFDEKFATARS